MSADDVATPTTSPTPQPAPDLLGQTVLVIGGSAGIGLHTARLARAHGAKLILSARDPDPLHRVGLELKASIAAFDATNFDRLERFFDALPTPIDHLLVTGPGPPPPRPFRRSTWKRPTATSTPTCCCRCRSPGTLPPRSARAGPWCSWATPPAAAQPRARHCSRRSRPRSPP
jgi:short chain dehydrogenase